MSAFFSGSLPGSLLTVLLRRLAMLVQLARTEFEQERASSQQDVQQT